MNKDIVLKKKVLVIILVATVIVLAVTAGVFTVAGGTFDVIKKGALVSFEKLLNSDVISIKIDDELKGYSLSAPDGSARFFWSSDENSVYDVMLEFDAEPFLQAGLDEKKLPANYVLNGGKLFTGIKYGEPEQKNKSTSHLEADTSGAFSAFEKFVKNHREKIAFHAAMNHFNVDLGSGNLFEWAQDMSVNDKDIVFALNPQVLIEAGVEPEKVAGWSYEAVPAGHSSAGDGTSSETVMKFLKPFDLE
ncbi:MAG: hypothetical protein ACI4MA_09415 [Treponema sp.]